MVVLYNQTQNNNMLKNDNKSQRDAVVAFRPTEPKAPIPVAPCLVQQQGWPAEGEHILMYRCGWGTKPGQEMVLALRLRREFFDSVLRQAVPSSFAASSFASRQAWADAVAASDVRLQWDPDHAPSGARLPRRALQLGLRGRTLRAMTEEGLLEVIDMTAFVGAMRPFATDDLTQLMCPAETVYPFNPCVTEKRP